MKRIFTLLFSFFIYFNANAQRGQWALPIDFNGTESVYDMSFSRDGKHIFVIGSGAVPSVPSGSSNPYYFYIGKYDTSGNIIDTIMPKKLGNGYDDEAYSMAIDKDSNIYFTGYFAQTIQIDKQKLKGNGGSGTDYYLAKLGPNDSAKWIVGLKTTAGNGITGMAVDVDDSGYVYVTGAYGGKITIGTYTFSSSNRATFFAKYDSTGKVIWAKSFGNYSPGTLNAVVDLAVEKNTASPAIYLVGSLSSKQTIYGNVINTKGSDDILLLKFDANGNLLKYATYGDKYSDLPKRLNISASGKLLLTGYFMQTTVLGSTVLKSRGSQDGFVAVIDTTLKMKWANSFGGSDYDLVGMAAMDNFDNVFVTGEMRSSPTYFGTDTLTLHDYSNAFLSKYDSAGKYLGAANSTGYRMASSVLSYQSGIGLLVDSQANIYMSGSFMAEASFGDSNNYIHTNTGTSIDIFTAKMKDTIQRCMYIKGGFTKRDILCNGDSTGTMSVYAVNGLAPYSYNWSYDTGYHASAAMNLKAGKYIATVRDYSGCILRDTATILQPSAIAVTPTIQEESTPKSGFIKLKVSGGNPPYKYSWKQGDTTASIDSLSAGTYHIIITDNNGCTQSDSFTVSLLNAISENLKPQTLSIFPDPTTE